MLVSVVVVCFNHADYLEECLSSIFSQSHQNFELIFIDAGSTDDSMVKVKSLSQNVDMQIYQRKGASLANNLNFGISLSKGKIFAPCAADDYWSFDKLEKQIKAFKDSSELFAISGNIIQVDESSIPLDKSKQFFIPKRIHLTFEDFFVSQYYFPSVVCSYDIAKLRAIGGFPEGFGIEDWPLYLKSSLNGYKHLILPTLLGFYRKSRYQYTSNQLKMVSEQSVILAEYSDHNLYAIAKKNWGMDGATRLASKHKKESVDLFLDSQSLKTVFDPKLYKMIIKLIFR